MTSATTSPLPLKGVRILDLSQALAGPFATMILGDLGAEIVKVEPPTGEITRTTPPHYFDGTSLYYLANNRNKLSVVVNLKDPQGRKVLYDLVRVSDVVFYNYAAGVAERLGVDHDSLSAIQPRIITCSVTGLGTRGEGVARPVVDIVAQALSGALSITGEPDRPPVRPGVATGDLSTGLYACIGILAALQRRAATGEGSKVEASLFHSQLSLLNYIAAYARHTGEVPKPLGSGQLSNAASKAFQTSDGWIVIEAGFNHHFKALCEAMSRPDMASDPRFIDRASRSRNRDILDPMVQEEFLRQPTAAWAEELERRGVPSAPVRNVAQALQSPQATAYRSIRPLRFGEVEVDVLATPLWFDGSDDHPMASPPLFGEHTRQVLHDLLGYDDATVAALAERGAVALAKHSKEGAKRG